VPDAGAFFSYVSVCVRLDVGDVGHGLAMFSHSGVLRGSKPF